MALIEISDYISKIMYVVCIVGLFIFGIGAILTYVSSYPIEIVKLMILGLLWSLFGTIVNYVNLYK